MTLGHGRAVYLLVSTSVRCQYLSLVYFRFFLYVFGINLESTRFNLLEVRSSSMAAPSFQRNIQKCVSVLTCHSAGNLPVGPIGPLKKLVKRVVDIAIGAICSARRLLRSILLQLLLVVITYGDWHGICKY